MKPISVMPPKLDYFLGWGSFKYATNKVYEISDLLSLKEKLNSYSDDFLKTAWIGETENDELAIFTEVPFEENLSKYTEYLQSYNKKIEQYNKEVEVYNQILVLTNAPSSAHLSLEELIDIEAMIKRIRKANGC